MPSLSRSRSLLTTAVGPLILYWAASGLIGCATPRAPKLSFEEALGTTRAPATPKRRAARRSRELQANTSLELRSALVAFAAGARAARVGVPRGSPMPSAQELNWKAVQSALDAFLVRPAEKTSSFDLVRARVAFEAELDLDARVYGDFPPQLAEQVLERVTLVAVRMAQVRSLGVKTIESKTALAWPVEPLVVTSLFGTRRHPITLTLKRHLGVDLLADEGQLVSAAGKGTVVFAGWNGAHGKHVELQHQGNLVTRYSHLSQLLVEPGLLVGRGDPLGLAGSTGHSTGAHVHFEVLKDGKQVDPLEELHQPVAPRPGVAGL